MADLTIRDVGPIKQVGSDGVLRPLTLEQLQGPPGPAGPAGLRGDSGAGVPVGGSTGQVLAKNSGTDGDAVWTPITPAGIGAASASATTSALAAKADLVGGVVPTAQIPAIAINDVNVVGSQAAQLALTAQKGDVAIRTDQANRPYMQNGGSTGTMADWTVLDATVAVQSVNGQTGSIVLAAADVGAVATGDSRLSDARAPTPGSVTNASVAAGAAIAQSKLVMTGIKGFVDAGSDPNTPRPIGFGSVEWWCTVQPVNAINGDTWINTSVFPTTATLIDPSTLADGAIAGFAKGDYFGSVLTILGHLIRAGTASGGAYCTTAFGNNQEAYARIATLGAGAIILHLRGTAYDTGPETGYLSYYDPTGGAVGFYRVDAGAPVAIGTTTAASFTINDTLGASIVGSGLTIFKNGVPLASMTDSTYPTGSTVGLQLQDTVSRIALFGGGTAS